MENQDDFFENNIVLDVALVIFTLPENGMIKPLSQTLSQDSSDVDPIYLNFKFADEKSEKILRLNQTAFLILHVPR